MSSDDINISDLLELIGTINHSNFDIIVPEIESIVAGKVIPELNLSMLDDQMSNPKDFPASIKIPNGIAEDMTDRTTMPCNTNLAKLAAGMMSSTLICWGVIRRPDRKLAFQFLSLRRSPKASTSKLMPTVIVNSKKKTKQVHAPQQQ